MPRRPVILAVPRRRYRPLFQRLARREADRRLAGTVEAFRRMPRQAARVVAAELRTVPDATAVTAGFTAVAARVAVLASTAPIAAKAATESLELL